MNWVAAFHVRQFKTCLSHHCTSNMPPTHWLRGRMDPSHTCGVNLPQDHTIINTALNVRVGLIPHTVLHRDGSLQSLRHILELGNKLVLVPARQGTHFASVSHRRPHSNDSTEEQPQACSIGRRLIRCKAKRKAAAFVEKHHLRKPAKTVNNLHSPRTEEQPQTCSIGRRRLTAPVQAKMNWVAAFHVCM